MGDWSRSCPTGGSAPSICPSLTSKADTCPNPVVCSKSSRLRWLPVCFRTCPAKGTTERENRWSFIPASWMKGLHIARHVRQHGAVAAETCSSRTRPRVARQSRVEVKHPFAPRGDWIVRLKELERARGIRPLKDAEHGVVGIARLGVAEKLLRSEGQPKRRKNFGAKWTDQLLTTSPLIRKTSRLVARLLRRFAPSQ